MLVLSRSRNQSVMIGDDLRVTVSAIRSAQVWLSIFRRTSPRHFERVAIECPQPDQPLAIADDISVTLLDVHAETARLGFTLPQKLAIHRQEVYDALRRER